MMVDSNSTASASKLNRKAAIATARIDTSLLVAWSINGLVLAVCTAWLSGVHSFEQLHAVHVLVFAFVALPLLLIYELLRAFSRNAFEVTLLLPRALAALAIASVQLVRRRGQPKFPAWTISFELYQALAVAIGDRGGWYITRPGNVARFRFVFHVLGTTALWRTRLAGHTSVETFTHIGLEHVWLRPVATAPTAAPRIVVLYLHGGGYSLCCPRFYIAFGTSLRHQLAMALASHNNSSSFDAPHVDVLLANYRKIPDHTFPAPVDDAMAMYDYVEHVCGVAPAQIVLAGDSAGGGLVLATLLRLRDAKRTMPAAALVICPYVDMLAAPPLPLHPSNDFIAWSMLTSIRDQCVAAVVAAGDSDCDALLREAVTADADVTGLPPLFVLAGAFDLLRSQSHRLVATAKRAGVTVELDEHAYMPHVFCILPPFFLPQAAVGVERLAAFAATHVLAARDQATTGSEALAA